jgi:UDP-N-acetylglucosamine--N-acetylmuramyl-(pentapeptide) pyrophosphoryl-undecaprenol N-acetylglucosamine transferase
MKILAVGGGSGGHVTPVAAVIEQISKKNPDVTVEFVCDRAFESQARGLMEHVSVPVNVSVIAAGKFRRYSHLTLWQHIFNWHVVGRNFLDLFKIIIGFFQSVWIILRFWPDVVFAKGGYVCMPLGIAAWLFRRPLVIHDSDTRAGLTNRVLARFATKIATGAPLENYSYNSTKSTYVGVPISDLFKPVSRTLQATYKAELGIDPKNKLVVATGGGLGAISINDAMIAAAPELEKAGVVIYNITGKKNFESAKKKAKGASNYMPVPFVFKDMHKVLAAADIVVTRASATFLQELAGLKKTVIAVPARQLSDQLKNATVFEAAGGVIALSDNEIMVPGLITSTIQDLLKNESKRDVLASKLHEFARPNAASDTAEMILSVSKHK